MVRRLQRLLGILILLMGQLIAGFGTLPMAASATPVVTEYPIPAPTGSSSPAGIAVGSDGNLWFTEWGGRRISKITQSGVITQYPLATLASGIAVGSDGAIWFGQTLPLGNGYRIGRITTTGILTEYPLPPFPATTGVYHMQLVAGSDGAVWYTEYSQNGSFGRLGRITTNGEVTEYAVPGFQASADSLAVGPDGAIWFGKKTFSGYRIGRVTTSGVFSEYPLSSGGAVGDIVAGPDGALWFAGLSTNLTNGKYIARLSTTGVITNVYALPSIATGLTFGPDGRLWFAYGGNKIGTMSLNGELQDYAVLPTAAPGISESAFTPDGTFWVTESQADKIGRISGPQVDVAAPAVVGMPYGVPNEAGWYNQDVTINWEAVDPDPSSGTPTTPPPTFVDQEGEHAYISQQSCDPAGNCATGSTTIKLDKTVPNITYILSADPNAAGWHKGDVTVTFSCDDAVSGVATCSEPVAVHEGANQTITGTAVDVAGNVKSVDIVLNIDATTPTISRTLSASANAAGWFRSDVTIEYECSDSLSGLLSCSTPTTLSEGAEQSVTGTAIDIAGNEQSIARTFNVDKTAPALGAPVWTANPKSTLQSTTLSVPAYDNLSGVAKAEYFIGDTDPGEGNGATMLFASAHLTTTFGTDFQPGVYKISFRAQDTAGNWSAAVSDYLVVYGPLGFSITGKHAVVPSLAADDVLPGLLAGNQRDKAIFAFSVKYNTRGVIAGDSDMMFEYETGANCNKPAQAVNCHKMELNATNISWLVVDGANDSRGVFQGRATVVVDGVSTTNPFRVTGIDGGRLGDGTGDHFALSIFAPGADPNTATPIYRVSQEVASGNIKIR